MLANNLHRRANELLHALTKFSGVRGIESAGDSRLTNHEWIMNDDEANLEVVWLGWLAVHALGNIASSSVLHSDNVTVLKATPGQNFHHLVPDLGRKTERLNKLRVLRVAQSNRGRVGGNYCSFVFQQFGRRLRRFDDNRLRHLKLRLRGTRGKRQPRGQRQGR